MHFLLNGRNIETEQSDGMSLLDYLRECERLTGTRSACRGGDCGACQILLGERHEGGLRYRPVNSCLLPLRRAAGCHVVTVEGLSRDGPNALHRCLSSSMAIQCGFCTPGLMMAVTAFLLNAPASSVNDAIDAVGGNLCRCTGYMGIKRALRDLCRRFDLASSPAERRIDGLIAWELLPSYFADIDDRMESIAEPLAGEGGEGIKVAGATDLMVRYGGQMIRQRLAFLAPLENLERREDECVIDATTRIETLRLSPLMRQLFPDIAEDLKRVCSHPVRQQATVGGNLVNASPIGDMSVYFLALDASLTLASSSGRRDVPLKRFFLGYKRVDLKPEEELVDIRFRCLRTPLSFSFEKVCKREYLDIAGVNSAMSLDMDGNVIRSAHVAAGGVAPMPLYLHKTGTCLQGAEVNADTVRQALATAQEEIEPIADFRGSIKYKRLLLRQLLIAHFLKLFPETLHWEELR